MKCSASLAAFVLFVSSAPAAQAADLDGRVSVQGTMVTSAGTPANGTFGVTFGIFASETGGTALYIQQIPSVQVAAGLFDATIGPLPLGVLTDNAVLWLEADVEGDKLPRSPLRASPYALQAQHANVADLALDLSCTGCVAAGEVGFAYAASSTKGGAALGLDCTGCVVGAAVAGGAIGTAHLADAAVSSAKVAFPYAGSTTKGGAALDLGCAGCVSSGEVDFSYAGSSSKGGAASDLECTNCVVGTEIATGAVGSVQIADGSVTPGDVAFNFAASATKGGAASDVACAGCVASDEVGFGYAASGSKGGAATDLACTGCVAGLEVAAGAIVTAHLQDGAVTSNKAGFDYAASSSKGGAATDLACTGCVSGAELVGGAVGTAQLADGAVTSAKVGFNFAASASKGGAATDVACSGCVSGGELASDLSLGGSVTVAGSMRLGNNSGTCNSALAGAIRWTGTKFEGCDGSAWVEFGGGGTMPPEGPFVASAVVSSSQSPTVSMFTIPGKTGKRVTIQKVAICGDSDSGSGSNRFAASGSGMSFSWEAGQNNSGATYHIGVTPNVGGSARGFVYKDLNQVANLGAAVSVVWDYHNDWDGRFCQATDVQGNTYSDPASSVRAWVLYYYTADGSPGGNTVFSNVGTSSDSIPKTMGTIPAVSGKRIRIKQIGICGDSDSGSGSNRFQVSGGGFSFSFEAGQNNSGGTYHIGATPPSSGGSARGFVYKTVDLVGSIGQGATVTWDYHNDWDGRYCEATDVYGTPYSDPVSSVRPWISYVYE